MRDIIPCLWFDRDAEEAARFYASLLPDSRIDRIDHAASDYPGGKEGDPLVVEFTLMGRRYQGINGGPQFPFTEAVSFVIRTEDQAETDRLWDAFLANGGSAGPCGWLKDRWGLSWQIVPVPFETMLKSPDRDAARRVNEAMFAMQKIDLAAAEKAFAG